MTTETEAVLRPRGLPETMEEAPESGKGKATLFGGLAAALLTTVCCIVPLVLLSLGIGGAWVSNLTALTPYKPYIIAVSVVLLGIAYWQIFLKKQECEEGKVCAIPKNQRRYKMIFWFAAGVILVSSTITWWAPLFY